MQFPYLNAQAGRESVSLNAVMYLAAGLAVLIGFAWWANESTTPKPRQFGVTPSAAAVYASATPNVGLLPAIVFGPSPTPEREIRPYGYLGDTVIGAARTAQPTATDIPPATPTQVAPPTATPDGLFRVYLFMDPISRVEFVEYPHLIATEYLPPGVLVMPPDIPESEARATLDVAQRRHALTSYVSPTPVFWPSDRPWNTPTPTPTATPTFTPTWTSYQAGLMATVQAWESIATATPPAPATRAVGAAERFSEAAPLAFRAQILRVP
jgi:hypothetical protein